MNRSLKFNETSALLAIAFNAAGNGCAWKGSINDSARPSALSCAELDGVLSSLELAGMVISYGTGPDALIELTEDGAAFVAAMDLEPVRQ